MRRVASSVVTLAKSEMAMHRNPSALTLRRWMASVALLSMAAIAQAQGLPSWNDGAPKQGWTVVDMKRDLARVFPFDK